MLFVFLFWVDKFTGVQEIIDIKRQNMKTINPGLYIVSTPIGNLEDISERAIKTINCADLIICENPKHSIKLLNKLGIKKKLISLHDYNEKLVIQRLSKDMLDKKIVLISDAGSPLISDPGYKLVQFCIKNKINISAIPGACSIIPALQLSGLAIGEFYFAGFFPKRKKQMVEFVKNLKKINKTSVFLLSSHKVKQCLDLFEKELKDRSVAISKELTKLNERVFRGSIEDVISYINNDTNNLKGEFVVVVEGAAMDEKRSDDLQDYYNQITMLLEKFSLTDVVEIVHKLTGIRKNKIYTWALSLKK
tara:strand:- start:401 stop:1318 length:918 start_codon:yes stop_codon:yes gene_type:complete